MKQAAILLSRQALHPTRNSQWVEQVKLAVDYIAQNKLCLIVSVGVPTYELIMSAASQMRVPRLILIPNGSPYTEEAILNDFALNQAVTSFQSLGKTASCDKSARLLSRDQQVIKSADVLFPISIRSDGNMERMISVAESSGTTIDRRFEILYNANTKKLAYTISRQELNLALVELPDDYIYHWTRTSNSKWPNEKPHDFYKAILSSDQYPRSALATLSNILSTGCIIGSQRHMPRGYPTVSFSGLHPSKAVSLMRWRSRYREMSFEPYGIGVKKNVAEAIGVKQVIYFDAKTAEKINPQERWRYQSIGMKNDWRTEKEFRSKNDFVLSDIDDEDFIIITRWSDEAEEINKRFTVQAISMLTQQSCRK